MPNGSDTAGVQALVRILARAAAMCADGRTSRVAIARAAAAERAGLVLYRVARAAWGAVAGEGDPHPWLAELTPPPVDHDEHAAANGAGALAIVHALAGILERAEALRSDGHDTHGAIVRAVKEHRASQALACVAFAAWMLAVGGGEASA
jgi:hypothetical protein